MSANINGVVFYFRDGTHRVIEWEELEKYKGIVYKHDNRLFPCRDDDTLTEKGFYGLEEIERNKRIKASDERIKQERIVELL